MFGANDITALGILEAAKKMNFDIPKDMEVIGFDDIKMAAWPNNQLTTWAQPLDQMINKTINILINGDFKKVEQIKLKGKIKFRNTTK